MFAKVYLDKTTHFLQTYFGEINKCSFESFSSMGQSVAIMARDHGFEEAQNLISISNRLEDKISWFRDKVGREIRSHRMRWA